MSDFQVTEKEAGDVIVIATDGYLNNIGGEKISEVCDKHIENGIALANGKEEGEIDFEPNQETAKLKLLKKQTKI